ncbi:hypothetical protein K4F52_009827 [Lecanicillium sp. MT-2017a]|nr:hypothetical protein K4F52_009827 [Lecanicillium sp. MT-2017a]
MVPSRGAPYVIEYAVKLEELEIKGVKDLSGSTEPVTVVLDNGAPQNVLPEKLVKPIQKTFEALSYTDDNGVESDGYVNCAMGRKFADARFGFKFTGKTIYISGAEAVRDIFSTSEQTFLKQKLGSKSDDWDGVCFLAFAVQPEGAPALVGDPLLRHAYAVYDMDNKVIALAQANIKSTKHNLVEIGKDDEIPDTKGDPMPKSIMDSGSSNNEGGDENGISSGDGEDNDTSGDGDQGGDDSNENDKSDDDDQDGTAVVVRVPVLGLALIATSIAFVLM